MTENTPPRQMPVCLPPVADELLSSWIGRHAAFYAVPPLVMLRHCLPEVRSLRAADLQLSNDQEIRLAKMFTTESAAVRRMTFTNVAPSSRRMISARPLQCCANCSPGHAGLAPTLRSQLLGWRITCPLCGDLFQDVGGGELPSSFQQYRNAARRGEKLLNDEAWHDSRGWASPAEIVRLLLMRRVPLPPPPESEFWRFRVLGSIIPELDETLAAECTSFPTPQNPVLPLHLRSALLAGVAIVHRAGAEMLHMLRRHTHGLNQKRFDRHALPFIARPSRGRRFAQMQLI